MGKANLEFLNPGRGIKEAPKVCPPRDLEESNALYGAGWKQGFFAITGSKNAESGDLRTFAKLLDPFLFIMMQMIQNAIDTDMAESIDGFVGGPDFVNPLYWLCFFTVPTNIDLFKKAADKDLSTGMRGLYGALGGLLSPITLCIALATLLTTYLWTLAKAVVGAVTVTLSSPVWYPALVGKLKHDENQVEVYQTYNGTGTLDY